jgi:hypothetical protein
MKTAKIAAVLLISAGLVAGCKYGPVAPEGSAPPRALPPTTSAPVACADTATLVNVTSFNQEFDFSETRATGHYKFNANGLKISTEGTASTDKVAAFTPVTANLSSVAARSEDPSLKYNNVAGGIPGIQMRVAKADGTGAGTLVGEPGTYGPRWWSNTDYGVGPADGYVSSAPLEVYADKNPGMKVTSVGFSLGSGVKGEGTVKSLEFNGVTYRFATECE